MQQLLSGEVVNVKDKKKKGTIEISNLKYDDNSDLNKKLPKIKGFSVSFYGFNEGSASPCKDEKEVKEQIAYLKKTHSINYNLEIKDKRDKEKLKYDFEKREFKDDENNDWNDINKIVSRCEKENEPYHYAFVKYSCKIDLNGKEEYISFSESMKRRKNELGSMFGSEVRISLKTEEDKEKFKEKLLHIRKKYCDKPYVSEGCVNELFLTDIKKENTIVSFEKKAKEYLEKKGFSVEDFYKDFNSLEQKEATKKDISKARTFNLMEKQSNKLKDECRYIRGYFENVTFLLVSNMRNYYENRLKELNIPIDDLNKLKEIYNQKAKIYQTIYKKIYFQRFGKKTNEEYSLP